MAWWAANISLFPDIGVKHCESSGQLEEITD